MVHGERVRALTSSAFRSFDRNAAASVLAGASVPLFVLGPAAFQAPIALAFLLALPGRFGAGLPWRLPAWLAGLAVVVAFWAPSLFTSIRPDESVFLFARTLALIYGVAVIQALLAEDAANHALFLKAFLVSLAAMSSFALFSLFVDPVPMVELRNRTQEAWHAIPHILQPEASVLLLTVPIAVWAAWRLDGWGWKLAAAVGIAAFPAIALGSGSRSSLAGLLAMGTVCALVAAWRHPRYRVVILVVLLVGGGSVAWLEIASWQWWVEHEHRVGFLHLYLPVWLVGPHRQVIWRFVFERFLDRPLFGWGIGAIKDVPGANEMIPVVRGYYVPSHPHSCFLEILSETGLVGALPFVSLLALWMWRCAARYVREGAPEVLTLIALLFAFFGAAAFNFSIWRVWWPLSAMVLAASVLAARPKPARPKP